jgi:hypothetical protein
MLKPYSKFGLISVFILVLFAGSWNIASMQRDNDGYYPQTGHRVGDEFVEFYQQIPNPEQIYGFPITEPFQNVDGVLVQYFQRARFEFQPEAPEELRIRLTPLGNLLYEPVEPFPLAANPNACQTFPETDYEVCLSFLEFFEDNGGIAQFGYPISNVEKRDDRFVQYFQRARFEWYPEGTPFNQNVQLTHLGRFFFDQNEDPFLLRPTSLAGILEVLSIQAHAFPAKAAASLGDEIEIFTIVRDQNLNPIPDANVTITLTSPSNIAITYSIEDTTNKSGFVRGILDLSNEELEPGFAEVEVTLRKSSFVEKTRTSFRITE